MKKMEYDQIVLIIFNHKGFSEHNFIISLKDLKESCSDFANLLEKHKKNQKFDTYHLAPNKTMSAKMCRNMQEFNLFVTGGYNEIFEKDFYWKNEFCSDEFGRLLCKDPFQNEEHCYDLY